jgi:hypothetical protein
MERTMTIGVREYSGLWKWLLGRLLGERNPLTEDVNIPRRLLADSLVIRFYLIQLTWQVRGV